MTDSYQAVYDAVRSRISGANLSEIFEPLARDAMDMSRLKEYVTQEFCVAADALAHAGREQSRPSAVYRPKLFPDGHQWCALYGDNLQEGVAGFGDTPSHAMTAFDLAWLNTKIKATL